jgi:hypothetical protein
MSEPNPVSVYQLNVSLIGISPMIWRRLLVRSDSTITDLHYTIQIAMGWSDVHLNCFHIHGKDFGVYHEGGLCFSDNPEKVTLSTFAFRIRERFLYEYDFGDEWLHEVRVEKRLLLDPKRSYPVCIGGKQAAPPEDCGGVQVYMQIRQELKYRAVFGCDSWDENDLEYEIDQENQPIDPDIFSRRAVNTRLKQYINGDRDWLFSY